MPVYFDKTDECEQASVRIQRWCFDPASSLRRLYLPELSSTRLPNGSMAAPRTRKVCARKRKYRPDLHDSEGLVVSVVRAGFERAGGACPNWWRLRNGRVGHQRSVVRDPPIKRACV